MYSGMSIIGTEKTNTVGTAEHSPEHMDANRD